MRTRPVRAVRAVSGLGLFWIGSKVDLMCNPEPCVSQLNYDPEQCNLV